MKIITLMKQTPDTAQLSSSMNGLQLMAEGGPRIMNPWDEYTLETGVQLKEQHKGSVTLLCLGAPEAKEAIKRGLAMGADDALLVSDPALASSDSLGTARALSAAIQKIGPFDLVVAGRTAIDGNTAATAAQLAALLDVPLLSYVAAITAIDPAGKTITVEKLMEQGRITVTSTLPCVISVVKEVNEPRYPSFMGLRKASRKKYPAWGLADLGLDASQVGTAGAKVSWATELLPVKETKVEFIEGSPAEAVKTLAERLLSEKVI